MGAFFEDDPGICVYFAIFSWSLIDVDAVVIIGRTMKHVWKYLYHCVVAAWVQYLFVHIVSKGQCTMAKSNSATILYERATVSVVGFTRLAQTMRYLIMQTFLA